MAKVTIRKATTRRRRSGGVRWKYELSAAVKHPGQKEFTDLGVICERIVTNAFIQLIVDELTNTDRPAMQTMKFHGSGTGTNAESGTDTALQTEVETRDTGTQTSPSAGQYRTVATHTYGNTFAITEQGVFSAVTLGTLLDRSVFSAINVVNGSQIQWTYTLTISGS